MRGVVVGGVYVVVVVLPVRPSPVSPVSPTGGSGDGLKRCGLGLALGALGAFNQCFMGVWLWVRSRTNSPGKADEGGRQKELDERRGRLWWAVCGHAPHLTAACARARVVHRRASVLEGGPQLVEQTGEVARGDPAKAGCDGHANRHSDELLDDHGACLADDRVHEQHPSPDR